MKQSQWGALALSLTVASGTAGADESDLGLWLEAGASYELADDLELSGQQHLRFDRDVSRISSVSPETEIAFEPWSFLQFGAAYRYEYERDVDDEDLETRHRLQVDGELKRDVGPVDLRYRMRLQDHVEDDFASPTSKHRLKLEWDRGGRWEPSASGELYYDLDDRELSKLRTTLGVEVKTGEMDTEVFYRMDLPKDAMDPIVHIMGLGVGVDL